MSRNNNSNNPRDRKPGIPRGFGSNDDRSYAPARSDREKNEHRVTLINRVELSRSDRENDLYERQSI